eukprot:COSAG01_NODE_2384_length_7788_cov_8.398751_7_plen_49_part_00
MQRLFVPRKIETQRARAGNQLQEQELVRLVGPAGCLRRRQPIKLMPRV